MAFHANPIRFLLRSFASVACLLAILLLTTPCAMAQQPPALTAAHCADCCNQNPALTTPQFCCATHPQPAQPSAVTSAAAIIPIAETLPAPSPILLPRHRTILISASFSPPPLHPILRI